MLPIVLAHGIARFDALREAIDRIDAEPMADDRLHYFRRIRSTLLAQDGWERFGIYQTKVEFAASVAERSASLHEEIADVLEKTQAAKVHIIAHSMGGLDARHMMFNDRNARTARNRQPIHERVASLTTIGTPHLGTPFADWGVKQAEGVLRLLELFRFAKLDGFKDLTTTACARFNDQARAFEETSGVFYQTIAGAQERSAIFAPLQFSWGIINDVEGPNDGLVSLTSARWREADRRVKNWDNLDADHLNQIGWWDPNELLRFQTRKKTEARIRDLYVTIVKSLLELERSQ